jgi:hypothetical protein
MGKQTILSQNATKGKWGIGGITPAEKLKMAA